MNRTFVSIVAAIIVAMSFAAPAQACVSCSYQPEVLKAGESAGKTNRAARSSRSRAVDRAVTSRRKHAESRPSKSERRKKITERARKRFVREPETEQAAGKSNAAGEANKPAETAAIKDAGDAARPAGDRARSGCKKFFPSLNKTLTVECAGAAEGPEPAQQEPVKSESAKSEPEAVTSQASSSEPVKSAPVKTPPVKESKPSGCKKYYPSLDMTLTVQCD